MLTARKRPRTRSAGSPMSMATTAVTAPPKRQQERQRHAEFPRWAAMSEPTATRPNWPRDTWPAQPVRTVRDRAMTA